VTADVAEAGVSPERTFQGRVTIEWPAPDKGGSVLQAWRVTIRDAETGECINTATAIRINAGPEGWVVAEMEQFLGMDGQPLENEPPDPATGRIPPCVLDIGEDGRPKTGTFRYLVTGMRVRS